MAVKVVWTYEAEVTFSENINYLLREWSEKEVRAFVQHTEKTIARASKYPESYPRGIKTKTYRKARLNKYIVLFYRYYKTEDKLVILTFWNVKQDVSRLKYK